MSNRDPRPQSLRLGVYNDDPVSSLAEDLFSRSEYADRIAQVARELTTQVDSAVIALVGPTGSGKTSMLNFVRSLLTETNSFRVVTFNPWIASDLPSLVTDFFSTLRSTMPGSRSRKLRRTLVRYAKKTAPILGTVSVAGVRVNTQDVVELFGGDSPLAALRDKLTSALQDLDVPVLVTIDDIDRLQADELILIAKLMRLVGRLPNVYYLVGFDEKNIVSIVSGVLPGDNTEQRARLYLERTVQVKFYMPTLDDLSAYRLFSGVLESTLSRHGIAMQDSERDRLLFFYRELLARGLREPSQIRRFCSYFEPDLVLIGSDLDTVDYIAVSYLRFAYPRLADFLRQSESQLTRDDRTSEHTQDINWAEQLADAGADAGADADATKGIGSVLSGLFPAIGPVLRTISPRPPSFPVPPNGVSSPRHFRRYFDPSSSLGDLGDHTIQAGLKEVLEDQPGYVWSMMAFYDLEQAVPKLRQHAPSDARSAERLLRALTRLMPHMPYGFDDAPTAMPDLFAWMVELANLVEPDDPVRYLRSIQAD